MKKIDTTQVTDPATLQPWTTKSLKFVQDNIQDHGVWLWQAIKGSTFATPGSPSAVCIYGGTRSGNIISDGVVADLFSGELRTFTGADVTAYINPPMVIEDNSYDATIDPILFSDNSSHSVHQVRKWKIADVASGSFLYSALLILNELPVTATMLNSWVGPVTYKRDLRNNTIYLNGRVTKATAPTSSTLFNLPVGYRPSSQKIVGVYNADNTGAQISRLVINTNGDVLMSAYLNTGTINEIMLDCVSFRLDI